MRRSPSTSSFASISSVNSAASVQGQRIRKYPSKDGQNIANQQHSVASTQNRYRKVSQGSLISFQHELEIKNKISENISVSSQKRIDNMTQQSNVSEQANPVSSTCPPIIETNFKNDHQTNIESVAGESVISVSNFPLTQEIINTEDILQRLTNQVLLENMKSQFPCQQSGIELQQTGKFQVFPITNASDLEQNIFSKPDTTAVQPIKQMARIEVAAASLSFDKTTTSLSQTLFTEQVSEKKKTIEHHSVPTKNRKDPVLICDGITDPTSSPLMLDHTDQHEKHFLYTTPNSMESQFVQAEQFINRPNVLVNINNLSLGTSIVNQHQFGQTIDSYPVNSPIQSQYGVDDSFNRNGNCREAINQSKKAYSGTIRSVGSPLLLDHNVQDERHFLNTTLKSVVLNTMQISKPSHYVPEESQFTNSSYVPIHNQSCKAIPVETFVNESIYDQQTDFKSVAGESVVSVNYVPPIQKTLNTKITQPPSDNEVLVEFLKNYPLPSFAKTFRPFNLSLATKNKQEAPQNPSKYNVLVSDCAIDSVGSSLMPNHFVQDGSQYLNATLNNMQPQFVPAEQVKDRLNVPDIYNISLGTSIVNQHQLGQTNDPYLLNSPAQLPYGNEDFVNMNKDNHYSTNWSYETVKNKAESGKGFH